MISCESFVFEKNFLDGYNYFLDKIISENLDASVEVFYLKNINVE